MSSEAALPRTAVAWNIDDPVQKARAELKAALAAIEEKANVPKRVAHATERGIDRARRYGTRHPATVAAGAVGLAAAVGASVWGIVRLLTR